MINTSARAMYPPPLSAAMTSFDGSTGGWSEPGGGYKSDRYAPRTSSRAAGKEACGERR